MKKLRKGDPWLLGTTIFLVVYGFIIFASASLSILADFGRGTYTSIVLHQLFLGVIGGFIFFFITSRIPYGFWKKYSPFIFVGALILTLMVFVPGIGYSHGGATRWLYVGGFSFQPAELLKLAFVIYFATWASNVQKNIRTLKFGMVALGVMLGICGVVLLAQPDTDTLVVMTMAAVGMFVVAGAKWRHFFAIMLTILIAGGALVFTVPYIQDRVVIFMNPGTQIYGDGYQIHQSFIAVGSGDLFGRGLGQSVQKFDYLPEPYGDSIFAILAEELGFFGSSLLVGLYCLFAFRGFSIASRAKDTFGRLLAVGIVILIVSQAFLNIASLIGLFPLAGLPLPLVSHGGSALFISLGMIGILYNISRSTKRKKNNNN